MTIPTQKLKDHSTELRDELLSKRPATLPWKMSDHDYRIILGNDDLVVADVRPHPALEASAYLVHAANSYPRLVKALRELLLDCEVDLLPTDKHPARALLKELGEWSSE